MYQIFLMRNSRLKILHSVQNDSVGRKILRLRLRYAQYDINLRHTPFVTPNVVEGSY